MNDKSCFLPRFRRVDGDEFSIHASGLYEIFGSCDPPRDIDEEVALPNLNVRRNDNRQINHPLQLTDH